jgi:DNA-binding CsgD family transcriptional regulator
VRNLFGLKNLIKLFSIYSIFAQKAKGDISTQKAKKDFDLDNVLNAFHSFDLYTYALVDIADLKIVKVGVTIKQLTGYDISYFEGKGYFKILKLHSIHDLYKSLKGGIQYFNYFYAQKKENRPFIKANRTLDLIRKDGSKIHVLIQGIPVLFNDKMEAIMFLIITTDISAMKTDHKFSHFIIDASDENDIKKIVTDHSSEENDDFSNQSPSPAEKKILVQISQGLSSKQIADKLFLSEHTVKTHRKNLMKKNQCGSSSELVRKAILNGWI